MSGKCLGAPEYLCVITSPPEWVVCDRDNVGSIMELNNITYTCTNDGGKFRWVGEVVKVEEKSFLEWIVDFFKNLFSFLM